MRNQTFRKVIVYAMVALMLLSSLMMGLSFVL
ncbi:MULTISPECIES: stressosome-associated protein Prli42 [Caryophanaceae]|uniref:Stressosome-associated protein Prli42 n=1 Tax=Planomicrobium okeanokoites TaxID=244 RepID=A0ABV7KQB7_PLAOK|nr:MULTISPECIES: stressosome-associated protein Prli42 [Planococcaceae]QHJ71430.1 stressosome-associated protein Prli42 [Planococcus halotolerans]